MEMIASHAPATGETFRREESRSLEMYINGLDLIYPQATVRK